MESFGPDDIVDYLNQELPGFEPKLIREPGTGAFQLRVRSSVRFAAYADISDTLVMHIHGGWGLRNHVDEFVRRTRQDAIDKLGLQKEIDAQVQRNVQRERAAIEAKAFKDAYEKAMQTVASSIAQSPSLDAIRVFLEGVSKK